LIFANKHHNNVVAPTFSGPGSLATRKEVEKGEWDEDIRKLADAVKSRPGPRPARGRPVWDADLECWVYVEAKVKASTKKQDPLIEDYMELRDHPMFGFMVQPAKASHPKNYLPEDEFLEVVRREYLALKMMMLKDKFR
jgi:hypothetical protein